MYLQVFKTDSAESSSNEWKNYVLKIYSQHSNFENTIKNNSLKFIPLSDPAIKFESILEKVSVKTCKNA